MWCVAELDEEYVARMEDVLAVYEKPLSAREPVVCIDEKPLVLHEEVRPPVAMQPGRVARGMPNIGVAERPMFSAASSPRRGGISPRRPTTAPRPSLPITRWTLLSVTPRPIPSIW